VTLSRPRILVLIHRVPYPPNRGDRIRTFHILQFLARRADVSLAFLSEEQPTQATRHAIERLCCDVACVRLGGYRRWINAAWSLARGRTATEGLFKCNRLRRLLTGWCKSRRFDAVVAFCSSMVQFLDLPELADVPVLLDLIDVDSQKWFDYAARASGVRRSLFNIEGGRLRRLEQSLPSKVKAIALVSRWEAELYRSFCPFGAVFVISNGVDLDYFQLRGDSYSTRANDCVFIGALDYRANIDGIDWFCGEIWPEVRRRRPDATFTIVGSRPAPAVLRLAKLPGVRLARDVPDVRPYLAEAALAVVPLRIARGVQNKVLEALAMAKAVVATPEALEGIGVDPGVHACEAREGGEWIESVVRLLADQPARERLGRAGRRFVEAHHCWDRQLQPLATLLGLHTAPCEGSPGISAKLNEEDSLASCHD
jgi:sugar transferase (PEP-CTERM/EpsH1 system associated)